MRKLRDERGIALPVTIFIIALLTITLAASFARVDADRAVAGGTEDAVTALTLAESGLQSYFGSQATRPNNGDSVRINLPGGYTDVVAHVAQRPLNPGALWLFVVRATSHVIVPEQGALHQAARTVAQFAYWQEGAIRQFAAFTAANDMSDENDGTINGNDLCGDSAAAWAVFTQTGSSLNDGNYIGGVVEYGDDDAVADSTGVLWNMVVNGLVETDYNTLVTGETAYKSHLIQGNVTINNASGTGLLMVTGDLRTVGTLVRWDGLILVGDEIDFDADSTAFLGMVISGLRAHSLVGSSASDADIGENNDDVYIHYDSCKVRQSLASMKGFAPIGNGWVDNWPTY